MAVRSEDGANVTRDVPVTLNRSFDSVEFRVRSNNELDDLAVDVSFRYYAAGSGLLNDGQIAFMMQRAPRFSPPVDQPEATSQLQRQLLSPDTFLSVGRPANVQVEAAKPFNGPDLRLHAGTVNVGTINHLPRSTELLNLVSDIRRIRVAESRNPYGGGSRHFDYRRDVAEIGTLEEVSINDSLRDKESRIHDAVFERLGRVGDGEGKPLEEHNLHETHLPSRTMPSEKIELTDDEDARTDAESTESLKQQPSNPNDDAGSDENDLSVVPGAQPAFHPDLG